MAKILTFRVGKAGDQNQLQNYSALACHILVYECNGFTVFSILFSGLIIDLIVGFWCDYLPIKKSTFAGFAFLIIYFRQNPSFKTKLLEFIEFIKIVSYTNFPN